MRLMSRITPRSAGAAALSLVSGLAQAHAGHEARALDGHVHLERLAASAMALIGPFAGELAALSVALGVIAVWRGVRRSRSSR